MAWICFFFSIFAMPPDKDTWNDGVPKGIQHNTHTNEC